MNEKMFCFIICTNDDLYLSECIQYINQLLIPEGYTIDLITITNASSMCSGYNEALQASSAKYKIYLHQDVFILNKNFLFDILYIFNSDPQIGLIGMVGYEKVSPNGIMWHSPRFGNNYVASQVESYSSLSSYKYEHTISQYKKAALVDGFMMITQYDIEWPSIDFDGWDLYDAAQSIRFLQKGYHIAVPNQTHPWCLHDDGHLLSLGNYDKYRQVFIKMYSHCLGKKWDEISILN